MKRRSLIKGVLSAIGAAVTGVKAAGNPLPSADLDVIIEAHKLVPNPLYMVTSYIDPYTVDCTIDVAGGETLTRSFGGLVDMPIETHPNWEVLKEKYGAFYDPIGGGVKFPEFIPEYRTGEPEPTFIKDDPEEGWWKTSEEWDAEA
jgi:hypothetical protein